MNRSPEFYQKFIEKSFSVVTRNGETIPFKLNPIQRAVLKEMQNRDIVLKARRHGISTLILAIFTVDFILTENFNAVVVSHEKQATQRLLDMVKFFIDSMRRNLPPNVEFPVRLKYASRNELVNEEKNSRFYVGTAGSRAFGRGDNIHALHLSEATRYPDLKGFLVGVYPAMSPNGWIVMESTANGFDYFQQLWDKNYKQPNPYHTHFIPWFDNPDYVEFYGDDFVLTPEEVDLARQFHLSKAQIAFYRKQLAEFNGDIDMLRQEFPSTAQEAFIMSGNNVWSPQLIRWYQLKTSKPKLVGDIYGYNSFSIVDNERGNLRVWKEPDDLHTYVIGVDVSEGKSTGDENDADYSCIQVLDQTTLEQVAVWHGRIDPDVLGREVDKIGRYYNNAFVAVERNSIGLTTVTTLRDLYYPNLYYREKFGLTAEKQTGEIGWVTDRMTKDFLISLTTQLLRDKRIIINDEETIVEMSRFVRTKTGSAEAQSGEHDDRVMAFMIALKMLSQYQRRERGNPIEREGMGGDYFFLNGVPFGTDGQPVDPSMAIGENLL